MNFGNTIRLNKTGSFFLAAIIVIILYYAVYNNKRTQLLEENGMVDLRKVLIGSIQAAEEGGRKVIAVYNSSKLNTKSKGGVNNPVTDADLMSHCAMFYGLINTFPQIKVISEEHASKTDCLNFHNLDLDPTVLRTSYNLPQEPIPASDITVWIDPLDATQEFTEKLVEYVTTMVCVAVKGVPVLGVIHFPFSGETTWAWVGKNAPTPHRVVPPTKVKIITSRSHKGDVADVVKTALGKDVEIIQAGGAGYKSIQVASNNVTAYIHTSIIKKWDICAGDAVLRALGGKMTTLHGKEISYGAEDDAVNKGGVLATLTGHDNLLKQFASVFPLS